MKKITLFVVAATMLAGSAIAQEKACCKKKGEKCAKESSACCKKGGEKKAETKKEDKPAK